MPPKNPYRFSRHIENLIANLRGIPEEYSRETPPNEKGMGGIIDRLLLKHKIGVESLEDRIRESWTNIVGPANARQCHPVRIEREQMLIIAVPNPVVRQELAFNKAILLKNIKEIEGGHRIRNVVFKSG